MGKTGNPDIDNFIVDNFDFMEVAVSISSELNTLEKFKEHLQVLPVPALVDGYSELKDTGKRINAVTDLVREEILTKRFNQADSVDEKGHRYFSGETYHLKLEQRVSKPKLKQEEAYAFFEEKGLLHKVSEMKVSLSTDDIRLLIEALSMLTKEPGILSKVFNVKASHVDVEEAALHLSQAINRIKAKGSIVISEDKVSALIALEELSVTDIEHLFDTSVTYAFKTK